MIPRDKLLHLALGVLWLVLIVPVFLFPLGPALAYATTIYAVMYEFSQWWRKDGQPELLDAVCTALPGFVAWFVVAVAQLPLR